MEEASVDAAFPTSGEKVIDSLFVCTGLNSNVYKRRLSATKQQGSLYSQRSWFK